ncbi:MAG: peptidase U32 family protein [archaeon]
MVIVQKKPELLAPAQDLAGITAASQGGADSVYFGLKELNMRATAKNFELRELKKVIIYCHKLGLKAYLTLNTILYNSELEKLSEIITTAKLAKVDAIICWDFAVISECKKLKIPFHISTQASISNCVSAQFYKNLGAERIVLARECSLSQVKDIRKNTDIEIEAFIHGAMCVSESGRCFTSQFLFGRSANRGDCIQPCRREYIVRDTEEGFELKLQNNFVMSAKDLCTIQFIDKLIEAGINAFKIEGRTKGADYVRITTGAYRKAINAYFEGKLTNELKNELFETLKSTYNRGFSSGFYLAKPDTSEFAAQYGGVQTRIKLYTGKITNCYNKAKAADVLIQDNPFAIGDEICIIGPTTGCIFHKIESIEYDIGKTCNKASVGKVFGIKVSEKVRIGDCVYLMKDTNRQVPKAQN